MAKTKFESFVECLRKSDLDGVRNNLEKEFLDQIIDDGSDRKAIHFACWKGDFNIVKLLVDQKCNIESEDKNKCRPIHLACFSSNIKIVQLLINQNCNIESEDQNKWRPIHFACRYPSIEIVKILIDKNCNIESEDKNKCKPIHLACQYSSIEIVKLLINQNCNIESEDKNNWRPIHFACQYSSIEIVKLLINQNCNIESQNRNKWKPIHFACCSNNFEIVKFLIDLNCNIESQNESNSRPIHFACQYASIEIVELLIDQKCDIESFDISKWRPIHFACLSGDIEKVKLLFRHNCYIEVRNNENQTPLEVAKFKSHKEIVQWIEGFIRNTQLCNSITNNQFDNFVKYCTSENPLMLDTTSERFWLEIAYNRKADKFIKFFMDKKINPLDIVTMTTLIDNDVTQSLNYQLWEEILLYKSIRDHNLKGFQLLCCPNIINRQRKIIPCSFLEAAAEHGSFVLVDEILKKSIFDSESWNRAKVIALEKRHNRIAESISERESLLKCRQKAGLSMLHIAVCDNEPDMVEYILKYERLVDPNHNHEILGTAFALAIMLCSEKCLLVLTRFNVNFNTRNKYLQTPLHEAISNGMIGHCRYLIDCTKDIDETGFMGQSALHLAVIHGCEELCDELVKKGADCLRYIEFLQHSTQIKDSLPLTKRENALTLCAKVNKTIYPCFFESLDANKTNSCDEEGNSLIHLAATLLNKNLCQSLISKGGNVNALNKHGNPPLYDLLSKLDKKTFDKNEEKVIETVNVFIDSKCNINQRFRGNLILFNIALQFNSEKLLLALLPPLKQNQFLEIDQELFRIALEKKFFRFCEALLEFVAEGQYEQYINTEMINVALQNDQQSFLKYLVNDSSLKVKESMIEKVLYHFAKLEDEDSFQCLLDLEIKSPGYLENGETLLTGLLKERKLKFCQKFIQSYKNIEKYINLKNKKNQTPLQVSIEMELIEMVLHFAFKTVELDNEDIEGQTALMQLFEKLSNNVDENRRVEFMNAVRKIIYIGGNIYHKTKEGVNIIEYCSECEARQEIESYFLTFKQKEESVEKEVEKNICKMCMDREVDSAFIYCGHITCSICSENIVQCPFCDSEIVQRFRIF